MAWSVLFRPRTRPITCRRGSQCDDQNNQVRLDAEFSFQRKTVQSIFFPGQAFFDGIILLMSKDEVEMTQVVEYQLAKREIEGSISFRRLAEKVWAEGFSMNHQANRFLVCRFAMVP